MTKHGCKTEEDDQPQTVDIIVAEPPFNDASEDADLILRSSNNVHFYVNKTILAIVSPVFKNMISIPNQAPLSAQEFVDHRPCVPLQDDSVELYQLLSWCDPRGLPSISLEAMQIVLRLADKYGMDAVIQRIENVLESMDDLVKSDCVRVYALSIQYHFLGLIQKTARYSLSIPVHHFPTIPEFDNVTGGAVQKLYAFHLACSQAAAGYIQTGGWINEQYLKAFCVGIPQYCQPEGRPIQFGTRHLELKKWFATYIINIQSLVLERPIAAVVLDPNSYNDALIAMASCVGCRHQVGIFFSLISQIAEGVEEATKEIKVVYSFISSKTILTCPEFHLIRSMERIDSGPPSEVKDDKDDNNGDKDDNNGDKDDNNGDNNDNNGDNNDNNGDNNDNNDDNADN